MTVLQIHIKKIESLLKGSHPNGIEKGYEKTVHMLKRSFNPPEIGKNLMLGWFISSPVTKIIDEHTFETKNSVYHWEILKEIEP